MSRRCSGCSGCVVRQKRAAVASRRPGADQALDKTETLEKQLAVLMFDQELSHGLPDARALGPDCGPVRDRLSVDAWRTLGRLHTKATVNAHLVGSPAHILELGEALEMLDDLDPHARRL